MPWIFNFAYVLVLAAAAPWLFFRGIRKGKYREGWGEKLFGRLPERTSQQPCYWLHAVSVGEVLQLRTVVDELRRRAPEVELVITTTTATGRAVAEREFPSCQVCYCPLDFSWAVRRALRRIRPDMLILVELELWPNLIFAARRAGVSVALINARVSERSHRGYRRIRPLLRRVLGCIDVLAAQDETYAARLRDLGASAERLTVTGSIKFDRIETDRRNKRTEELRTLFGIDAGERVIVAGSTQAPEEHLAVEAWQAACGKGFQTRLILVPRHPERFDEVARMVESCGLPLRRRSRLTGIVPAEGGADSAVILLDTVGELGACWGLADIAFVGGSLTNRGGQNMIEPAAYGAAVLFGPNTFNFQAVVSELLSRDAARVVQDGAGLQEVFLELLSNPGKATELGERARSFVLSGQGATRKTVDLLTGLDCVSGRAKAA